MSEILIKTVPPELIEARREYTRVLPGPAKNTKVTIEDLGTFTPLEMLDLMALNHEIGRRIAAILIREIEEELMDRGITGLSTERLLEITIQTWQELARLKAEGPKKLEKSDFITLSLSGKPIGQLARQGIHFWFQTSREIGSMCSPHHEVMVPAASPFIPESNNHRLMGKFEVLRSQMNDLLAYNQLLGDSFTTEQASMVDLASYSEIAHLYLAETGRKYFDGKYARTTTQVPSQSLPAQILEVSDRTPDYILNYRTAAGGFHELYNAYGINLRSWFKSGWSDQTYVFPVIVIN